MAGSAPGVVLAPAAGAPGSASGSASGFASERPAASICAGKSVTIVASTRVRQGTEGDDVVAMKPLDWNTFDALGGDDTICLDLGWVQAGRDIVPSSGFLNAGPGDDVVINLADSFGFMAVGLGSGDDHFTGSSFPGMNESVYADTDVVDYAEKPPAVDPAGEHRDVIDMGDGRGTDEYGNEGGEVLWSAAPPGASNPDRITFGTGTPELHYDGAMAPEGSIDFGGSSEVSLHLPRPGATEPLTAGEVLIDNVARRASVAGTQVLAWQGQVSRFVLGTEGRRWPLPVSFQGSDADETLTFYGGMFGDLRFGAGNDSLSGSGRFGYSEGLRFRSMDGGPGVDYAGFRTGCRDLTIRLAGEISCGGTTAPFRGIERVEPLSRADGGHVTVVGTDADDWIAARAERVTVRAGAGDDDVDGAWGDSVRVHAGPGDDTVLGSGDKVRVDGGAGEDGVRVYGLDLLVRLGSGADIVSLHALSGRWPWSKPSDPSRRAVAFGGPGNDDLRGTTWARRGDRLVGGPGRDRADGRSDRVTGVRDHCDAEVRRRCR
ncbi:hypothetical protein [Nocardioides campestrisoli]|uniref:hypothetical protein n=1 Tax=Nocardioides campestrisoli TaxID=2736757 RepID=UPI0015E7235E|nr:hypothetical protein [Nocardioides campestrisoli]